MQGHVYHWKHGWIPLTHVAALQKAHGSKTGAAKIEKHRGITPDVSRTHPVGARVEARQPGINHVTHGQVVGHTSGGMVQVEHTNRHGQPVVGTFNPAHTSVAGATTHEPHAAPHALKPGEHATVRGTDQMGQPITLTGKVTSNSPAAEFGRGRTTGGKPLRTLGIEREGASGMTRTDHVNVPDPSRGEVTRQSNAQALAAARRIGVLPARSPMDSMSSIAPRDARMRGEHVPTAREVVASRAAMKDASKRSQDVAKAAQQDPLGKNLLAISRDGAGGSTRSAIVRAAEDVGQGNRAGARQRLEKALDDARYFQRSNPGDKSFAVDVRALRKALAALGA